MLAIVVIVITTAATTRIATMRKVLLLALSSLMLIACQKEAVYTHFESLPGTWSADSTLVFHPVLSDSVNEYQVLINIRHTDRYPYQNLWLFTIEAQMANERGEWQGQGISQYALPLLYLEGQTLIQGDYTLSIQQGMRTEKLPGITEVGVRVEVSELR